MGISIREALELGVMDRTRVVAGKQNLDRVIKWVNILEVLDEISLLQEGELLITTAFGLTDDPRLLAELVPRLAERGLAALAIQTGYYLETIPTQLIRHCDQYGLPLLELPKSAAFADITKAILKRVINRQMEMLEYTQRIHLQLTQVVLQNEGFPRIAQVLSELLDAPVRIFDRYFNLLAYFGLAEGSCLVSPQGTDLEYQALKRSRLPGMSPRLIPPDRIPHVPGQVLQPLVTGNDIHGFISVISHGPLKDLDMIAVSVAATISTLEMLKEKAVWEAEERVKGDFLDDLMEENFSSQESLRRRANYLGYDLTKHFTVLWVDIDNFAQLSSRKDEAELQEIKRRLLSLVRLCLQSHNRQALIKYKSDNIIILLQVDPGSGGGEARSTAELIRQTAKGDLPLTVSVGIGRCYADLSQLPQSLREAEQALSIGKRLWKKDRTVFYDDLGVYRLFTGTESHGELESYYHSTIHPLVAYDREHNSKLLMTLEAFFDNNAEIKETAERLFVHRHTLKYRLNRIREITGLDPENCQDRFRLQLGIVAAHLLSEA